MNVGPETDKATARIIHIESHLDGGFNLENALNNIEHNQGDPTACIFSLSRHALASAMSAWFSHHDLGLMRQWCYVAAKLDQEGFTRRARYSGPAGRLLQLLKPLLSNHAGLINWFANDDDAYDPKRVENPKTWDFWAYQGMVALRGEWDRLIERCERVINDPPKASEHLSYLIDHQFWLALAHGNVGRMQDVLQAIVTPKLLRSRRNFESGYTEDLISTPAVIYAKIAWCHGYKPVVDTPYIPSEWLPMAPLSDYDNHYGFLGTRSTTSPDLLTQL